MQTVISFELFILCIFCKIIIIFVNLRMEIQMFLTMMVITITFYWLLVSIMGYKTAKDYFLRAKKIHQRQIPTKFRPFTRKRETLEDEKQIIKGCFIRLPYQFFLMTTLLLSLSLLSILKRYLMFPGQIVQIYRKYYGRWVLKFCTRMVEQFDANQRISTPIIISNHSIWMEIIYFGMYPQLVSFVAKSDLKKVPLVCSIPEYYRCLYVDRESSNNRTQILNKIRERVEQFDRNQQKAPLVIYPQGTVSNGKSLLQFKNGAFDSLSSITMFSLHFQDEFFEPQMADIKFSQSYILLLAIRPLLKAKKTVMKPNQNETVVEYRQRCRSKLAQIGGYKLQDSSYGDLKEYLNFIMQSPQGYKMMV